MNRSEDTLLYLRREERLVTRQTRYSVLVSFGFQFPEGALAMVVSIIITRAAVYGLALVEVSSEAGM